MLSKSTLANQVRDILADRILAGIYPPGYRLIELTLAKELGVSQAPVREALQVLESMRVVESAPNRGTYVRHIPTREMAEATIVRGILEEAAARIAVTELQTRLPIFRKAQEDIIQAFARSDLQELARCATRFHVAIVEATGNEVLIDTWHRLNLEAKSRLCATTAGRAIIERGIESHQLIIDAFAQGDGERAAILLREQAERCAEYKLNLEAEISAQKTVVAAAAD